MVRPLARWVRLLLAAGAWMAALGCAAAIDPALLKRLPDGDNDEKVAVIRAIVASGDAEAAAILKQMAAGDLKVEGQEVSLNNRIRRELESALAALQLFSTDRDTRAAAIRELANGADESMLPLVRKAAQAETDPALKGELASVAAQLG